MIHAHLMWAWFVGTLPDGVGLIGGQETMRKKW